MNLLGSGMLVILVAGALPLLFRHHPRLSEGAFRLMVIAGCGLAATYLQFIIGTVLLLLGFLFFTGATPSP